MGVLHGTSTLKFIKYEGTPQIVIILDTSMVTPLIKQPLGVY